MKLIVGLGNPGRQYQYSRHNIGFQAIKALSQIHKISLKRDNRTFCLSGKGKIEKQNAILAMPLTYMNLSGISVSELLKIYKIGLDNLLVVCDDLDLELGRLKIRALGSSGGHRGLQSIIDGLKSQEFSRLRIGIDRPHKDIEPAEYVLAPFSGREKPIVKNIVEYAVNCCHTWLMQGVVEAMNIFNGMGKYKTLSQPLKLHKEGSESANEVGRRSFLQEDY